MTTMTAVRAAIGIAAVALLPVAAGATTMTKSYGRVILFDRDLGYVGNPASIPRFDTAGRTLDSVEIEISHRFNSTAALLNSGIQNANFGLESTSVAAVVGGGQRLDALSRAFTVGFVEGAGLFGPPVRTTVTFDHFARSSLFLTSGLDAFRGPGDVAFTLFAQEPTLQIVQSLPGLLADNAFWRVTTQMTVTYTSSAIAAAIPEPASWAMLVTGFGLAGASMRRQRRVVAS